MHYVQENTRVLSYADDLAIYKSSPNLEDAMAEVEGSLVSVDKWLSHRGLKISVIKTQLCVFSKRRLGTAPVRLQFNEINIMNCTSVIFLGVYLDTRLNWKEHINITKNKAQRAISIMKAIAGFSWGAHPSSMLCIYTGLVRAILDWGSYFYEDAAPSSLESLERVQYAALRIGLGCLRRTPTNVLLHLAGVPPLRFRRLYLTNKYMIKMSSQARNMVIPKLILLREISERNRWGPSKLHFLYRCWEKMQDLINQIKVFNVPVTLSIGYFENLVDMDINVCIGKSLKASDTPNQDFDRVVMREFPDHIRIFTDGSRINDPPRAAAALEVWEEEEKVVS